MKALFSIHRFSVRILLGFVALIITTTLSAGVPAFWLTRSQLERQTWTQVENARRATESLLNAERSQLKSQLGLFTERPTLHQLVRDGSEIELQRYLEDFQGQIGLDILVFCSPNNRQLAGNREILICSSSDHQGFAILNGEPAILAQETVEDPTGGGISGTAVAGNWLDENFLERLAAVTGTQQSILGPDGKRLASSFATKVGVVENLDQNQTLTLESSTYFAAYLALVTDTNKPRLTAEIALNVDELVATERRAFTILAISTGLVALLGSAISIGFVRQVIAPLRKLTSTAEKISQGDLFAAIPLFSDPVEIRTLAEALHRSQASMLEALQEISKVGERLNTILQSIVEGVVTCNLNGRVTFWSAGAHKLLGWSPEETHGAHINQFFPLAGEKSGQFSEHIPLSGQKIQVRVHTRSGVPIVLALTSAKLMPPGSDTHQTVLVFRDVTGEEAARRLRSYFLANISHEFRTPLSTMNASMELLLDDEEQFSLTEIRELLRPMYVSMLSLQTLIDNLLESSSIEAGQFMLHRRTFPVHEAIENALNIARPLLVRRGQSFNVQEPFPMFEIEADPTRMTQVLVNLIINASKYSPIGQSIDLILEKRKGTVWVGVADRGPGIPDAERENIFRSFVRLNSGDREQYGIGLGLYVVKTVIDAHGGQIGVLDQPGGGSLFWFEIPLRAEADR